MTSQPFFKVYDSVAELPIAWDDLNQNIFLHTAYLKAQEDALPANMDVYYVAFYQNKQLVGKSIFQNISINKDSFIQKKNAWQNVIGSLFRAQLLCIGNIKVTGENAYELHNDIHLDIFFSQLHSAIDEVAQLANKAQKKVQFILIKDFYDLNNHQIHSHFLKYNQFEVEPNMVFHIKPSWHQLDDYIHSLKSKYRTRLNRAFKKADGIIFKELSIEEIGNNQESMYQLYINVLENIDVSFYKLPKNYFYAMKSHLKDDFKVFAGYNHGKMVCFYTLIHNHAALETGFLGYDEVLQQPKQLYLNMLYKMIAYGIEHQSKKIIFSRSALEIKSSVGAEPVPTFGLLKHTNYLMNKSAKMLFNQLYDAQDWVPRNPFKS